jgi:hypothetical protein
MNNRNKSVYPHGRGETHVDVLVTIEVMAGIRVEKEIREV